MKFWLVVLGVLTFLGLASGRVLAFKPETFISLTVPVYEYSNPTLSQDTLTDVDLIYKLSTPSASRVTWLIGEESLDTSVSGYFQRLLASDKYQEIGLRLETNLKLTEAVLPGSGRNDFTSLKNRLMVGYAQAERRKLIDRMMEKFFTTFGYYPSTVGAAYLDSFSLDYLVSYYSVKAAVTLGDDNIKYLDVYHPGRVTNNARQPYYPARTNSLTPSIGLANKINLPLIGWNLPFPGAQAAVDLTKLSSVDLVTYLSHWSLKSLNEFTQITLGTDNRVDPKIALAFYTDYFQTEKALRERLTLNNQTLSEFGEWFLARYPVSTPAYYFVQPGQAGATYSNQHYLLNLTAEGDRTRLDEVVWNNSGEAEPYWYQTLTGDELDLPVVNVSKMELVNFDFKHAKFDHEYWDLILTDEADLLRLEPERIISTKQLTWIRPEQVREKSEGNYHIYSPRPPYKDLVNQLKPIWSAVLLAAFLLLLYRYGPKK